MKRVWVFAAVWGVTCGAAEWGRAEPAAVVESERAIPVCQRVDVVVVGGSCGAVAAAEAAARAGAKVFLAAPRPYLGDDLAGTLRLWPEPDAVPASPLARAIFMPKEANLPFTYQTDRRSGGKHRDSGEMLCDSRLDDVQHHTVEFDGDVAILADLGGLKPVADVELVTFKRKGDFEAGSVHMSVSADGQAWSPAIPLQPSGAGGSDIVRYAAALNQTVRRVKVAVKMKPGAKRLLVSELTLRTSEAGTRIEVPTPLRVKQALDRALLDAGVAFLTGSFATDLLRDADGAPAGVVIANRTGRQAVLAKVIVDATERGTVARLAGAAFRPYPAGPQTFTRIVIAGEAPSGEGLAVTPLSGDFEAPITGGPSKTSVKSVAGKAFACELKIDMRDGSYRSFAEAEQVARDRTFVKTLLEGADSLFQVPPDPMTSATPLKGEWPGSEALDLGCFRPAGQAFLFVLGGCADMPREAAAKLLRPITFMATAGRLGAAAAETAQARPAPVGAGRPGNTPPTRSGAEVREQLTGTRPYQSGLPTVRAGAASLPVLGTYDVVVVGGGTGGAPAGIAAGRQGSKTLLIEYLHGLGGVGTLGMIGKYWYGLACGFTEEHDKGVAELGAAVHVVGKNEWWRRENRKAGTEIWFGVLGCGAWVEGDRVKGVVVATPQGRGVVLAKSVVDATGNADIAAAAGAACVFQGADELALQGVGLSPRKLGASYINSDFGYVNDCDAADLWLFGVRGRAGAGRVWDVSQLVESRERQRIVGDYWITPLDIVNERTFPDTVLQSRSNFDSHGYSVAEICYVSEPTGKKVLTANVPYRSLLPKGLEGVMVIGLGMSAHRDAMPILRMQPDVQNQGYAAGVAAAMSIKAGVTARNVDIRALQRHLIEMKILPKEVLDMKDSYPIPTAKIAEAVKTLANQYQGLSVVLSDYGRSVPLLKAAYEKAAAPEARFIYAHVLGMMGQADGEKELIEKVKGLSWDKGWNFRGMGQFNRSVSWMDSYVIALGRARSKAALPVLFDKAQALSATNEFSHFRAVAMALESIGDRSGAPVLAALLAKEGVSGHSFAMQAKLPVIPNYSNQEGDKERSACLLELAVARALYRLGDVEGRGEKVLRAYANDPRGAYANHAKLVLAGK